MFPYRNQLKIRRVADVGLFYRIKTGGLYWDAHKPKSIAPFTVATVLSIIFGKACSHLTDNFQLGLKKLFIYAFHRESFYSVLIVFFKVTGYKPI